MNTQKNFQNSTEARNDGNTVLAPVLFQDEINAFLKELFYDPWMDEDDWSMFLESLETQLGVSVQSLSNDLQVGLKNGHSIEKQFELVRTVLKKAGNGLYMVRCLHQN